MDTILALIKALPQERAHSACPIWSLPKEVKVISFIRPPSHWEARRLGRKGATYQSAKSNFCSTTLSTNSYFIPAATRIDSGRHCGSQLRWYFLKLDRTTTITVEQARLTLRNKFPCMYNCHYQFEVSITAIYVDSQMWGTY